MVAVAVANTRLFDELLAAHQRQAALARQLVEVQELERRRLAQEIHDDVSQSLTAIMLQLGLVRRSLPETGGTAQPILEQTELLTQETLNGVRRMIAGLRPPVLDELGLLPALRQLGHELQAAAGVAVTIESIGLPDRLSSQFETALFRITQEALANIRKHAHASRVSVILRAEADGLSLSVRDDGVGLPQASPPGQHPAQRVVAQDWQVAASHFGLIGIEERAAQLNGSLRLRSAPGQGTWLRVEFPLKGIYADHRADLR
jgi:signal transduction histidine kinase